MASRIAVLRLGWMRWEGRRIGMGTILWRRRGTDWRSNHARWWIGEVVGLWRAIVLVVVGSVGRGGSTGGWGA